MSITVLKHSSKNSEAPERTRSCDRGGARAAV